MEVTRAQLCLLRPRSLEVEVVEWGRVKESVVVLLILVNALSIIAMAPYIVSLYESAVVISFSSSSSGTSSEISSSSTVRVSIFSVSINSFVK